MKTLIVNGTTRRNGDTDALVNELMQHLDGDIMYIKYPNDIKPCVDCRHCQTKEGCAIQDQMQAVYEYLRDCDNIVLASPIWFSALSGPMLNFASRIQMLYATDAFRNEPFVMKAKTGVIVLTGGEPSTATIPLQLARTVMKFMGVTRETITVVSSLQTGDVPACKDEKALAEARDVALALNRNH